MPTYFLPSWIDTGVTTASTSDWTALSALQWVSWITIASTLYTTAHASTAALSDEATAIWGTWQRYNLTSNGVIRMTDYAPAEDAAARNARFERQLQQEQVARERRSAAIVRAQSLLDGHLSDEQRAQLARDNFFVVRSQKDRLYRIYAGQAGNIRRIEPAPAPLPGGQVYLERERFCIHPRRHSVPDADAMLMQKLLLETDEDQFLRVANRS